MLTEDDVVQAVCAHLERAGWSIDQRLRTTQRGIDIVASIGDVVLNVEAKGATSARAGSSGSGTPFTSKQVSTHVPRAFYTAAAALEDGDPGETVLSAMALPATAKHQACVVPIRSAISLLRIGVFWVEAPARVRLEAPWQLPRQ